MANYTNQTLVSQFISRSLTANEIAALNNLILNAVDKWINRKLESNFADVAASTRYYDGGARSIDIDPVQSVTQVETINNDTSDSYLYTEHVEFELEPVNETIKREIRKRGFSRFPSGGRRVAVTGKFTEYDYVAGAVPADIQMAATRLAAGILNAGKYSGQGENLQQEALEGHEIRYNITNNSINTIGDSDPIIQGMLGERRQLFIYDDDGVDDDDPF